MAPFERGLRDRAVAPRLHDGFDDFEFRSGEDGEEDGTGNRARVFAEDEARAGAGDAQLVGVGGVAV